MNEEKKHSQEDIEQAKKCQSLMEKFVQIIKEERPSNDTILLTATFMIQKICLSSENPFISLKQTIEMFKEILKKEIENSMPFEVSDLQKCILDKSLEIEEIFLKVDPQIVFGVFISYMKSLCMIQQEPICAWTELIKAIFDVYEEVVNEVNKGKKEK